MTKQIHIGIDIGSISVKYAILDQDNKILETRYQRHNGLPYVTALELIKDLYNKFGIDKIINVSFTGSGAKPFLKNINKKPVNEIVASVNGINFLYPEIRTVIELGGEDSKFLLLNEDDSETILKDFAMNSVCAAGTGSFLDQQASRLNINIENEFSDLALKSENPPRIAGRCSVFAKSDMIHLQQRGTPDYDIVAGLCHAVARNFKSNIAKSKDFIKPIAFIGGVAYNKGVVKAFEEILELQKGELVVPKYFDCIGAIGAVIQDSMKENILVPEVEDFNRPDKSDNKKRTYNQLQIKESKIIEGKIRKLDSNLTKIEGYLGIDVGSVSTNLVVIDENVNVLSRRYLATAGRPIEAVKRGLYEIGNEIADNIIIKGACTTGSGRYMIGDFIGADIVKNEITAQSRGAIHFDSKVDTIFEIGGQDSKYVSINNGVIVDFEMNKVCAAGTGSFLEEQAEKLGIKIKEEFQNLALKCKTPCKFGERCTVFIESDLTSSQQKGSSKEELVSGLAYSIVHNYLNKVVGKKRIGDNIFFQGGTANNKAVVAAFEKVLGKKITVPPHNDITGAIGAAIIAKENFADKKSKFKGFDLHKRKYDLKTFTCNGCSNVCEINQVKIENEKPLYYGHRCEKYDIGEKKKRPDYIIDVFKKREELLFGESNEKKPSSKKIKIGIPRAVLFYENFPFWKTFFEKLNFEVVLSPASNTKILRTGTEYVTGEFCFPIKAAFGHIVELIKKDIDYLFIPSIINMPKEHPEFLQSYICPYVQSLPYIIRSTINFADYGIKVIEPYLKFIYGDQKTKKELKRVLKPLKISSGQINEAYNTAVIEQNKFYEMLEDYGKNVLKNLKDRKAIILIGRPYNTCDNGLNLNIPSKLMDMGLQVIPIDAVPVDYSTTVNYHRNMYWRFGQKILAAADFIKKNNNLFGIYITNFGCGPDSMIMHYFNDIMKGKPYLQLEIDEHSADAGIITRCEAFLDSLKGYGEKEKKEFPNIVYREQKLNGRKLYLPYMSDHAHTLQGLFKNFGIESEVLYETTEFTADLGRKYTTGKECYPCITTAGDFINKVLAKDFKPEKSAFFFATASGPCRFGQYMSIHNLTFRELGYEDIPIVSLSSSNSYFGLKETDRSFRRKGWWAIVGTDILIKMLHETRPYEINPGQTYREYRKCIKILSDAIANDENPFDVIEECSKIMRSVETNNSERYPAVGLVGEIYLRQNRFSNNHLITKLEDLGLEVWLAPFAEWIYYTTIRFIEDSDEEGKYLKKLLGMFLDWFQRKDEEKMMKPFEDYLRYGHDTRLTEVIEYAESYMDRSFGGEAILTIGKGIDFIKNGAQGIVNVMPFSCMPGTITTAISKKVKEDYNNVPWLNISYDGQQDDVNLNTRLEAFAFQVNNYKNVFKKSINA